MAKRTKRISLRDIAQKAGVTVPTVSRILSNQTDNFSVRPEVRERVLSVVEELKYRPNVLAQSLRKEQMGIVGLLSVQSDLGYFQAIINGLMEIFQNRGIALCSTYSLEPHPVQSMPPWRIDGAIVVSAIAPSETDPIEAARIPYVSINGAGGPSAIRVAMDDVSGTRAAIEYLLRLGHKRIAYANIRGPFHAHPSVAIRRDTYLQVLREAGLSPVETSDDAVDVEQTGEFIRRNVLDRGATAVVAYHSYQAMYLLQVIQRLGLRVPADVSLLSLSGGYPLEAAFPAVTAVDLPFHLAGKTAAEMLLSAIATGVVPTAEVIIPESLTIRDSTGPALE